MKQQNPAALFQFVVTPLSASALGSDFATTDAAPMPSLGRRPTSLEQDHAQRVEMPNRRHDLHDPDGSPTRRDPESAEAFVRSLRDREDERPVVATVARAI